MLTRRSLLISTGLLSLAALLPGCDQAAANHLKVQLLRGSIPPQVPGEFSRSRGGAKIEFALREQLGDLFKTLQQWGKPQDAPASGGTASPQTQQSAAVADLVTLGDYWLAAAIQQKLIQPLNTTPNLTDVPNWKQLQPLWQDAVRRNERGEPAADGQIWAAPYRWGGVAIAYRKDLLQPLGWVPKDWADLWRPELQHRISLPDNARAVLGIALKKLGKSVNETDLGAIATLPNELKTLQSQVKFYSSNAYLQPLMLEDTWVAVGWSTDILPLLGKDPRMAAIFPQSGTILFADLWVRPTQARERMEAIAKKWIDFCWQPAIAQRLSLAANGASPALVGGDRASLPAGLQNNPLLLPETAVLDRSEFLLPLSESALASYQQLWEAMRLEKL